MPNFCINFLNKAEKSLPILYDFAVAPLTGAWIKTSEAGVSIRRCCVAPLTGAWIKMGYIIEVEHTFYRILHGCVVTCRGIKIVI